MMDTVSVVEIVWTAISVVGVVVCTWAWRYAFRVRDWVDASLAEALTGGEVVNARLIRRLVIQSRLAYGWYRDESIRVLIQVIAVVIGVASMFVMQGRVEGSHGALRFSQVAVLGLFAIQVLTVAKSVMAMRDRRWVVEMMGAEDDVQR